MTKTTDRKKQIVGRRQDGTGAYGLYVDYVVYNLTTQRLVRQERFFLTDNLLCKYVRQSGNKRAAWRPFPLPSHDEARLLLKRNIERYKDADYGIQMVYMPLIVELTSSDVASIAKGEPPAARYEGSRVVEKMTGKIDDDTWRPS